MPGIMTHKDFRQWRKSLKLSQKEAAEALGLKRRVVQYYEKGERDGEKVEVPKAVRLACFALAAGVGDYRGPGHTHIPFIAHPDGDGPDGDGPDGDGPDAVGPDTDEADADGSEVSGDVQPLPAASKPSAAKGVSAPSAEARPAAPVSGKKAVSS